MAIRTAPFKAGLAGPAVFLRKGSLALSWSGFLAIVAMREAKNRQTEQRKETP
jgi:hypothetical protein